MKIQEIPGMILWPHTGLVTIQSILTTYLNLTDYHIALEKLAKLPSHFPYSPPPFPRRNNNYDE